MSNTLGPITKGEAVGERIQCACGSNIAFSMFASMDEEWEKTKADYIERRCAIVLPAYGGETLWSCKCGQLVKQFAASLTKSNAERDELVKALEDLLGNDRIKLCDMLSHHQDGDRHKLGEACPPLARIEALLTRITNH